MTKENALYPIREISRLTNVTPITLRAWERRYGLIEPVRTESGHRLYTQEHVDFVNQAVELTRQGIPISKVKTVIAERDQAKQKLEMEIDLDYEKEFVDAANDNDLKRMQSLLDRLFVDFYDAQIRQIIVGVTQAMQNEGTAQNILWQSLIIPVLSARIRQGRLYIKGSVAQKKILIVNAQPPQHIFQRLAANLALQNDYNPLISDYIPIAGWADVAKQLSCEALFIIAPEVSESESKAFEDWSKSHDSFEVFVATNQVMESRRINLNYILLNQFEMPS
jgi:DNA-binding transcriptional MerR regulator